MDTNTPESQTGKIIWLNAIFLLGTPVLAAIVLPLFIWHHGVHWAEPVAMLSLWLLTGLGITAGYHRMFSHRAWWAPAPIRALLLVLGGAAWQNSVISWSAAHRYHHRDVDTDQDPYDITKGFWHAHMLWVIVAGARHEDYDSAPDLAKDPLCVWQHRYYTAISIAFNLGVPLLLGLLTGRVVGMLIWAGLLRVVLVHHMTFFINSLAHMWGKQTWTENHSARDNGILAFFTFGEGYHNFHHTFPGDYRNGFRWYHFDPTKWLIWSLARVGLATDLKRSPLERRLKRRWERLRERYQDQMESWEESFLAQYQEAEARFEEAVAEARAVRREWSQRATELHAESARNMRRACRQAERRMVAEVRQLQRMLRNPVLVPA
ncbi:MAG: fatty acid desaturase [Bradymonadaceae bacterium]